MHKAFMLSIFLLLAVALFAAPAQDFHYSKTVQVPQSGWYKILLDLQVLSHLNIMWNDICLYDSAGNEIPLTFFFLPENQPSIKVKIQSVIEEETGWILLFDLGPKELNHQGLRFDFLNRVAVSGIHLERSTDNKNWHFLANADLFRVGESQEMQKTSLNYDATHDRYLKLNWPKNAGYPSVQNIECEAVPETPQNLMSIEAKVKKQDSTLDGSSYLIELPGPALPLRRLIVAWEGSGTIGFRLMKPAEKQWIVLSEGILAKSEKPDLSSLMLSGKSVGASLLRLEFLGSAEQIVKINKISAEIEPVWTLFYASEGGTYSLKYGGVGVAPSSFLEQKPPENRTKQIKELIPGSETETPFFELPAPALALGPSVNMNEFKYSWLMKASDAKNGQLVSLEVPDKVYEESRDDLGNLRVMTLSRQVPYILWTLPNPKVAFQVKDMVPRYDVEARHSTVEIDLPEQHAPFTIMELATPSFTFTRNTVLTNIVKNQGPGNILKEFNVAQIFWTCPGTAALPCRVITEFPTNVSGKLRITLMDGDNPPLAKLSIRIWQRRDLLIFPWHAGEAMYLIEGSNSVAKPRYDIEMLKEQILARPMMKAQLGTKMELNPAHVSSPVSYRWLLILALAFAAIFLLYILARLLRGVINVGK